VVGGAGGGDHPGTQMVSQLHGDARNTAGAAVDEDGFSCPEMGGVFDGPDCGETG
jgi:hypothetical protein